MSETTVQPIRPFSAKRIKELTTAICQHGLMIPEGYTFDPRRNPPLFPTPEPRVAIALPKDVDEDTGPPCLPCDGACTGVCDPAGDDPEGSAP
jgi:hypothetical protein